jgi:aminomethyltransferase
MIDFHGWKMPLVYAKVSEEVLATRRAVGLFDLCHMGRLHLRGSNAIAFADQVTTVNVAAMEEGQVAYGFICNESGGVIDDITVYRADEYLMLVVNASNREAVLAWLRQQARGFSGLEIADKTAGLAMLALQGPRALEVAARLAGQDLSSVRYYHFRLQRLLNQLCIVSRTGYTGEDGFEIYFSRMQAEPIWQALFEGIRPHGGLPIGLAARDTLRLEAAMPLHGQELSPKSTPVEAGLEKFIAFEKRGFIGRGPLLDSTNSDFAMRLVCFEMIGQAIPRAGYPICRGEAECGRVTSGGHSPTLGKCIGMGYVEQPLTRPGTTLQVRVRGEYHPATIVRRPFYRRERKQP